MTATYLIRFDDICPEMNWDVWHHIEYILTSNDVKPILAVVPNNHDPSLNVDYAHDDFWAMVRKWQALGWAIGLHGYTHQYETDDPGLVGLNRRSEFAGLSIQNQQEKIDLALEIFQREGIRVDVWIAPAHSFDLATISALKNRNILVISDGYFQRIVNLHGMVWVPQQLWRFVSKKLGLWTVCYHHNAWSHNDLRKFENDIHLYRSRISSLDEVLSVECLPDISLFDKFFAYFWRSHLIGMRELKALSQKPGVIGKLLRVLLVWRHM